MSIHFRSLFEVEIAHAYYGGPCPDIEFVVPAATPALAAGRLLARKRNGRLVVLFEADDANLPLRPIVGTTLLLGLRVGNPYFANFTAAPVAAGHLPIYTNQAVPGALAPPLTGRIAGFRQQIAPALAERPLNLRWQRGGQTVAEQTLIAGQTEATFVTRDWPAGLYTLSEQAAGPLSLSHWLVHPELAGQQLWGVLAVTVDASFYASPPLLSISLTARHEQLKYYVVARNYGANEFSQLNFNDAGAAEQGRPALVFDKIASTNFAADDLPPDVLGDAASRIVLFQSRVEVDRRAGGYRKLQLRRNNEVLIQHLPQAGSDRAQARFIVHLAKS
jgi:hypothetical protein